MKLFTSILFALCISANIWAQDRPDALMWYESGMLFYGDKRVPVSSGDFAETVKSWNAGKVHISVSATTPPEAISRLILDMPLADVSYSLCLDEKRIASAASTEVYNRNMPVTEAVPFVSAEVKPVFTGGDLMKWVDRRVDELYPMDCWESGIQGRVIVQFTIDEQGRTCNVSTVKGADPRLDKAAERIILTMPDWEPARDGYGKPIKILYTFPVIFIRR